MNDENLSDVISKRANGFYYEEESLEYETVGGQKYLLCKKFGRLYFGSGFLKVYINNFFVSSSSANIDLYKIIKTFIILSDVCKFSKMSKK